MNKPAFYLNSHPIPGSFYGLVLQAVRGDRNQAALVFFRCHIANPANPIAWIRDGLTGPRPYALRPCKAEERGGVEAREWIAATIEGKAGKLRGMVQMRDALAATLADLSKHIAAMPQEPEPVKPVKREAVQLEMF
jgi:hypothetical protein